MGDYKKAEVMLNQAIDSAPFVSSLYLHKSIVYAKKNDYSSFVNTTYQYLERIDDTPIWTHLVTLIIILAYYENDDILSSQYKELILHYGAKGIFNISEQVLSQLNTLQLKLLIKKT